MRKRLWGLGAATLCVAAVVALAGCTPRPAVNEASGGDAAPAETTQAVPLPPAKVETVIVPDVLGMYYDDAAAAIKAAGLEPVEMSVHGPTDEDAGEIGGIYRETPKAGEAVAPGTKVELRYWWESQ